MYTYRVAHNPFRSAVITYINRSGKYNSPSITSMMLYILIMFKKKCIYINTLLFLLAEKPELELESLKDPENVLKMLHKHIKI